MVDINMSKEQLALLCEHLQGNETRESEAVVTQFVDQGIIACQEDDNSHMYL